MAQERESTIMTAINKPSVNDTTVNYNLKVGDVKAAPQPLKRGEHVSTLSVADQIWQGTKSGLKMSAWMGSGNFVGIFTSPSYNKHTEAWGSNMVLAAAPIAIGAVSGTVSAVLGVEDKVGKTMNELAAGKLTPLNVGFKTGLIANGMLFPRLAADALRNVDKPLARFGTTTAIGAATVATAAVSAHVGAKFAKGSASTGGTVMAGAAGGALTGAVGVTAVNAIRHAVAGTLTKPGFYAEQVFSLKGSILTGVAVGAAMGIAGALVQKYTRKAA